MTTDEEITLETLNPEGGGPKIVETRKGRVEISEFGSGPPILCLHGAMGGYDQSLILARTVGDTGHRYIAVSRPGYLGTPFLSERTPEAEADLLAALLDTLGIEYAAIMAVSGGGPSAIHFALRHAKKLSALVLISTVAQPVQNKLPLSFKLTMLMVRLPGMAARIKKKMMDAPEAAARRAITDEALFERIRGNREAWALLKALQTSTADNMPKRSAGTENDVWQTRTRHYPLEDISTPTLIVHGTKDPFAPFERNARVFVERIPGAELVALEGGEHAAIFTHRDEARARVTAFLRKHLQPSSVRDGASAAG